MNFFVDNWPLLAIALASGGMLMWPGLSKGGAGGLSPTDANPIQAFHTSRSKRLFFALMHWGWLLVPLALFLAICFKVAA